VVAIRRTRLQSALASAVAVFTLTTLLSACSQVGNGGSNAPPLVIATTAVPQAQVDVAYNATLAASGGTLPYTWTVVAGSLPNGVSLDAVNGALDGMPRAIAASRAVTFKVSDSSVPAQTNSVTVDLSVVPAPLRILTQTLPSGSAGHAYSASLSATGGTPAYTWTLASGALPAGLSLNEASGTISGAVTSPVTEALTFRVTDSGNPHQSASVTLTLNIAGPGVAPLEVTTSALPAGQVGVAYAATLTASGGIPPYSWSLAAAALPAGLTLNSATGQISGTPSQASSGSAVTFKVSDAGVPAQSNTVALTLAISPATLTFVTTSLPTGQVSIPYSASLAASGGTPPYSWQLTAGTLPAGLTLNNATGLISGTPSHVSSPVSLTFKVSDAGTPAQSSTASLTLAINPAPLTVVTSSLPAGQVGTAYSATLTASGGTPPYTWQLAAGKLPAGLTLSAGGTLSGTPTTVTAASSLTFKVTDSGTPAQSATAALAIAVAPAKLVIVTTSLPSGQVGTPYAASLAASGGTPPYSWQLSGGALPAGVSLQPGGALSGTPSNAASTAATFTVTDAGTPPQSSSTTLTLTIIPATVITVSVSPARAGLTVGETLPISATTNDPAGVTWSISPSGGSFASTNTHSGVGNTLTAPSSAGVYTVTATSVTSSSVSASFSVGVTNLAGIYTYHNDVARDGTNTKEYALTTANVNTTTFGKLFSCTVDGAVYAQPLWVANFKVGGSVHNVVFVATAHDSLFAFDADATSCQQLWQVSLIDTAHGGTGGEVTVPSGTSGNLVGFGDGDITPEVGVIGTPVIDPVNSIIYVVSKSMNPAGTSFYQRLHAIDPATGNERSGSPATIAGTYPGVGDGGSSVTFDAQQENQRGGLTLANGTIYIAWGSHEDKTPYYGWMAAYTYGGGSFQQAAMFNSTPNAGYGGIWMAGGAPSVDSNGNLYVATGNGTFDATSTSGFSNDFGDSFLQLSPALTISSWFAPSDEESDDANDRDQGSGGAALVLNLSSGSPQHLIIGGGKDGTLYLLNGDSMGGLGDSNARQNFPLGHGIFATGAFWNNTYYITGAGGPVSAFAFNSSSKLFNTNATSSSPTTFNWPGASPVVSASGAGSNGIVWALNNSSYCTNQSKSCGPAVLHAYDATDLFTELWNSSMVASDAAGNAVKFTVPTVANGKVYVGTRGNNIGGVYGSTSVSGELDVYGLKAQ
jgi:Putative Ig domain